MTGDILYRTAQIDNSEQTVDIKTVKTEFEKDNGYRSRHFFKCPCCGGEMEAVLRGERENHFRHKSSRCLFDNYLHSTAEQVFFEEYNKCLKEGTPFEITVYPKIQCNPACIIEKKASCSKRHKEKTVIDLTLKYKRITPEKRVLIDDCYRRPDLLLESESGEKLWVEIWVSHETDEEKRKLENILEIKVDSPEDIEKIRSHQLTQAKPTDTSVRYFSGKEVCSTPQLLGDVEEESGRLLDGAIRLEGRFRPQDPQRIVKPPINLSSPQELSSIKELRPCVDVPYWKRDKEVSWVNLGLPSGTLWSSDFMGNMSYEEAQREYPHLIPSPEQFQELVSSCKTTGPIPAGFIGPNGVQLEMYEGDFWTNRSLENNQALAFHREFLQDYGTWKKASYLQGTCFARADKGMRMCVRLVRKIR